MTKFINSLPSTESTSTGQLTNKAKNQDTSLLSSRTWLAWCSISRHSTDQCSVISSLTHGFKDQQPQTIRLDRNSRTDSTSLITAYRRNSSKRRRKQGAVEVSSNMMASSTSMGNWRQMKKHWQTQERQWFVHRWEPMFAPSLTRIASFLMSSLRLSLSYWRIISKKRISPSRSEKINGKWHFSLKRSAKQTFHSIRKMRKNLKSTA